MKKTKLLAAIACGVFALSLASCTKDRICTCTDEDGDTDKTTLVGVTKSQAKANCVSYTYGEGSDAFTVNCELD